MSVSVLLDRPHPTDSRATDVATWGATHLRVRDVDHALRFWHELLGLEVTRTSRDEAVLGVDDAELIVLHGGARRPVTRGHAGLYHVALHLPTARDFTEMLVRLVSRGVDPRPTDHLLHWAMYMSDGDGIGVELSFETADRFDRVIAGPRPILLGTDGLQHGPVEALAVRELVESFPDPATDRPMPPGTRVGHNHLHVGDLAASARFYERLGFDANVAIMGMRDFNARGSFPHRLALNEWQGQGAPPAPQDAAGLEHMSLVYADAEAWTEALDELVPGGSHGQRADVRLADPSGNAIVLTGAST